MQKQHLVADVHVGDGQPQIADDCVDNASEHAAATAAGRSRLCLVLALSKHASGQPLESLDGICGHLTLPSKVIHLSNSLCHVKTNMTFTLNPLKTVLGPHASS